MTLVLCDLHPSLTFHVLISADSFRFGVVGGFFLFFSLTFDLCYEICEYKDSFGGWF